MFIIFTLCRNKIANNANTNNLYLCLRLKETKCIGIIKGTTTRHSTPVGFLYTHEVYLNKSTRNLRFSPTSHKQKLHQFKLF